VSVLISRGTEDDIVDPKTQGEMFLEALKQARYYVRLVIFTGARYTRSHPPKKLLATLPYPDRSSASKAEYALKQLSTSKKRDRKLMMSAAPVLSGSCAAALPR